MSYQELQENTLLNAVTSTGAGTGVLAQRCEGWNFIFDASSVTTGASIDIEAEYGDDKWVTIHTEAITATGVTMAQSEEGSYKKLRANVTARTDGTYSVYAQGRLGN